MRELDTPPATVTGPLVRVSTPAPGARAEEFLHRSSGEARGFWSHGARWVAFRGRLVEGSAGASGRADRFSVMEELRRRLLAAGTASGVDDGGPGGPGPRLYGGFAFHPGHEPAGEWGGFPPFRFVLPEWELHGGVGDQPLLVRQGRLPGDADGARLAERFLGELEEAREDLLGPSANGGRSSGRSEASGREGDGAWGIREGVARRRWEEAVRRILGSVESGEVAKVVLARTLDVVAPSPTDPVLVLERLRRGNPHAHIYFFEFEPGRALVGAAPETVASLRKGWFHATAVAGSVAVGGSAMETRRLGHRLLESPKDRVEHACTVEDMLGRLEERAGPVEHDPEPRVLTLSRIQHLETRIRARPGSRETVLSLLADLHPTPAVCGLPRDRALRLLEREEPFRRGWYAGPVGWLDGEGEGVFVPALRSAVGGDRRWRLFAGAGLVAGSEPAPEWEETRIKFEPMLRALGIDPPR